MDRQNFVIPLRRDQPIHRIDLYLLSPRVPHRETVQHRDHRLRHARLKRIGLLRKHALRQRHESRDRGLVRRTAKRSKSSTKGAR